MTSRDYRNVDSKGQGHTAFESTEHDVTHQQPQYKPEQRKILKINFREFDPIKKLWM